MRHEKTKRRDAEAAKLRVRGRTYLQIADELGYASPSGAHDAVSRSLAESVRTPFEQQRELALNQLDQLATRRGSLCRRGTASFPPARSCRWAASRSRIRNPSSTRSRCWSELRSVRPACSASTLPERRRSGSSPKR